MYLAKVIKTGNRLYVYDAFNNKLATINSEKELFENTSYEEFLRDNDFRDLKEPCVHMAHPNGRVCGAKRPKCEAERSHHL